MFKKSVMILFLVLSCVAYAQKEALLVGVSDYEGASDDLGGIDNDTSKMERLFRSWGFHTTTLYDRDSMQVESYLEHYKSLKADDTFAFYYTGHGSRLSDQDGDEADGMDEVLVLSDGGNNVPLIDDVLNAHLNAIPAKKLIIFDSCHSGTAHKGEEDSGYQAKTLPTTELDAAQSKGMVIGEAELNGEYIVLSAAQDTEKSLATSSGSLFTNELYDRLAQANNQPLASVQEDITYAIVSHCKQHQKQLYHPKFSFANPAYKNSSIEKFLSIQTTSPQIMDREKTLQSRLDAIVANPNVSKITLTNAQESYRTDERITFTLDTNSTQGYLTILFVERDKVTVLYPNPRSASRLIGGRYDFPREFGNFGIRAFKNCDGCQKDKTDIYLLLTPEPLANIESMSRQKLISFAKGSDTERIISKDAELVFDEPTKNPSNNEAMIAKYSCWVE